MADDVKFAVIANIQQLGWAAFIPAQSVLAFQRKEKARPDTADSNQPPVRRMRIELQCSRRHLEPIKSGIKKAPTRGDRL
jgi:hypothetical protein